MTSQYFIDQLDDIINSAQRLRHEMIQSLDEDEFVVYFNHNAEDYKRVGDQEVYDPPEEHPMDFMFEGDAGEVDLGEDEPEEVTPEHVRNMLSNVFSPEESPKMDDQALGRAIQNAKGTVVRLESAALVLADKMQSETVRSPGGLFIVLCKSPNIEAQAQAIRNRSPEQQYSEATRAAQKKMDEKIQGRNLRGNKPDRARAGRFKDLAEGVSASGGS